MVLSLAIVRERIPTSLSDEALGALVTDTYTSIARAVGEPGPITELLTADAGDLLLLSRPAASITTVVENRVELDPDDYALKTSRLLVRLSTGPHPSQRWRGRPEITYEVQGDEAERDRLLIALISLDLNHKPGLVSQRLGQWSESYSQNSGSYAADRQAILDSYFAESGGFI